MIYYIMYSHNNLLASVPSRKLKTLRNEQILAICERDRTHWYTDIKTAGNCSRALYKERKQRQNPPLIARQLRIRGWLRNELG